VALEIIHLGLFISTETTCCHPLPPIATPSCHQCTATSSQSGLRGLALTVLRESGDNPEHVQFHEIQRTVEAGAPVAVVSSAMLAGPWASSTRIAPGRLAFARCVVDLHAAHVDGLRRELELESYWLGLLDVPLAREEPQHQVALVA